MFSQLYALDNDIWYTFLCSKSFRGFHVLSALGMGLEKMVTSDIAMVKILLFRDNSRALRAVQCHYLMKNSRIYFDTSFLFTLNEKKSLR